MRLVAAGATLALALAGVGISTAATPQQNTSTSPLSETTQVRSSVAPATNSSMEATSTQAALEYLAAFDKTVTAQAAAPPQDVSDENSCECPNVLDAAGLKNLQVTPGKQVVLLIHGIGEGPDIWSKKPDPTQELVNNNPSNMPTLNEKLAQDQNYTVATFSYNDEFNDAFKVENDLQFVDQNRTRYGPMLAKAIRCLAEKSGMKVSLVGHSRGGLIAQEALSGDSQAADDVAGLVSIDTPWIKPYDGFPEIHPIPSAVPVMPVGSEITLDLSEFKPDQNASQLDTNGLNVIGNQLHDNRVICTPVQDVLVVTDWYRTTAGDGCFQAKDQLSAPSANIVTDSAVQPVKCGPVKFSQLATCSGYLHEQITLKSSSC